MKNQMNPPKDGTMFLANFKSYPHPIAAMWNGASQEWIAAVPHCDMYLESWNDWYFENENFAEEDLESWGAIETVALHIPGDPKNKVKPV